jgi:hypothetical protein
VTTVARGLRGSPPRSAPWRTAALRAATLLALALAGTIAWGQPYAADGGFDRPRPWRPELERPLATLALDAGRASVVAWEAGAILVHDLESGAVRALGEAAAVRNLTVASAGDAPVEVIWSWRDLATGRYRYRSTFDDALLEASQLLPLVGVQDGGTTLVLSHRGRDGGAEIVRFADGGESTTLYRTELQIAGLSADAHDGIVHLTWIEGFTEVTAFGSASDWRAQAAWWSPDGRWAGPVELGAADGQIARTTTAAEASTRAAHPAVQRTWTGSDGIVRRWRVGIDDDLRDPPNAAEALTAGRPLGSTVVGGATTDFIVHGNTIWRVEDAGSPAVAVAWSPVVIREGWVVVDAAGVHHLLWIGSEAGGRDVVYVSNDRQPMARGPIDEIAAAFGWRPWSVAEEAAGQAGASLLAAVLVSASALPLLWLLAVVLTRGGSTRHARWRGAAAGVGLPALGMVVAAGAGAPAGLLWSLVGGAPVLVGASLGGALFAARLWRKHDMEPVPAFVAVAVTALAVATAVTVFVGFQRWLALGLW